MQKKLYDVTPTESHNLAGRVVGILKRGGLRDRPTLNRVHEIVETRAYDPGGLKIFLRNLVDMFTAPESVPAQPATAGRLYQEQEDRLEVLSGEQITGLLQYESTPATDLGEHFSLAPYETESNEWKNEEDE